MPRTLLRGTAPIPGPHRPHGPAQLFDLPLVSILLALCQFKGFEHLFHSFQRFLERFNDPVDLVNRTLDRLRLGRLERRRGLLRGRWHRAHRLNGGTPTVTVPITKTVIAWVTLIPGIARVTGIAGITTPVPLPLAAAVLIPITVSAPVLIPVAITIPFRLPVTRRRVGGCAGRLLGLFTSLIFARSLKFSIA